MSASAPRASVTLRVARADDAQQACVLVRRSITELCSDDHRNEEATLAGWLANKTPDNFAARIASRTHLALVAQDEGQLVGFALCALPPQPAAELLLLYVLPEARQRGISSALLATVEAQAQRRAYRQLHLNSTQTAQRFYLKGGFVHQSVCDMHPVGAVTCMSMQKPLLG